MVLSHEEVGQYIRLLCLQHQTGHFDALAMRRLCGGSPSASLAAKFKEDSNGLFYNERLEEEVIKRKKHSEKQKENANMRWHKSGIANAMPLEDVNENEIENVVEKENKKEKAEKQKPTDLIPSNWPVSEFKELWAEFVEMRAKKKKPLTQNAVVRRVKQLIEVSDGDFTKAKQIATRTIDKSYDEFFRPFKDESISNVNRPNEEFVYDTL